MPRTSRKNINSYYIHVIIQGIKKEYIFKKDTYKIYYIKLLNKISREYDNTKILAYCIMDNHAHLLIYTKEVKELSKIMSRVNTSYGIFYNKVEERVGYVFRNRYYSQEIVDEKHLFNTLVYIHRNPIKAGIVKKFDSYLFSSYNDYKKETVDKQIIELIFHSHKYISKFNYIHKNFSEQNMIDIREEKEVEIKKTKNIIEEFCKERNKNLEVIKKDNSLLLLLINSIKNSCNITNKDISEIIGIGKNRIHNIIKKED